MLIAWTALALANDPFAVEASVHTLDNGLTVVLSEDHNTDNIALHLHYDVGARDEKPGEYGCAHLFEHLMFEGSANVPTNAFDEWLTAAGGWNNAFTSEDETAYHETFPSGALDLALMMESDRMGFLEAGLDLENLQNQQKVVLQERAEGYAEPRGRNWDALALVGWPKGHPYQHTVIGTVADIEGYTIDGVVDFWKRHYRPRGAVLALVGNFETAAALERVEHWFSDVPDPGPPEERAKAVPIGPEVRGDHYITDRVEDRTVYLVWPTVEGGHADEPALSLLASILSGGRGTRLDDALQYDHSVASGVGAFQSGSEVGGQFVIVAIADDMALPKLKAKVDKQLAKFGKLPPTSAELDRAKKSVRAGWLYEIEGLENRAEVLVDCQRLHGDPNCRAARYAEVEAVTSDDVMRVFREYLVPEKLVTLSVVPEGDTGMIAGAVEVEIR
ncbi:MAG: insulinase family protein [Alphaproteobacteria bacterium]|nr:insulinase family protein [Alphaproteobacteria bacterium]